MSFFFLLISFWKEKELAVQLSAEHFGLTYHWKLNGFGIAFLVRQTCQVINKDSNLVFGPFFYYGD